MIRQRTQDGRLDARKRGVAFGRPSKLRPDQEDLFHELLKHGQSISSIARTFNVHPATIYRCIEEIEPL
ncbi:Hin recombinase [Xenorhabdus bovienii]|nr:Hin recombinase [Xenorhabdus bovienii]